MGPEGTLISFDRDTDAIKNAPDDNRLILVHNNFRFVENFVHYNGFRHVDGILADLGVSSHQFDSGERGFSFRFDAPLDMRMSQSGTSAADLVNTLGERELARIITSYGEEKFARNISKNIVKSRNQKNIETTLELAEIIKNSVPAKYRRDGHPARKTFQAIRIEVNDELSILAQAVDDMFHSLKVGGRLSVITFHSLEDRTVKEKFREFTQGCTCPKDFPICVCGKTPEGKIINKGLSAGKSELDMNNRSRSAKLRTIERLK